MNEFLQLTANGVFRGLSYAALGAGMALVLGVTGRFHFAYALTYVAAPYLAAWLFMQGLVGFWTAVLFGVTASVLLSVGIELAVYRPVTARAGKRALLAVLVSAMGINIAGIAMLQLWLGSAAQPLYGPLVKPFEVAGVTFVNFDLYQAFSSLALVIGIAVLLARTPVGRSIKAVRSNPPLARSLGINVMRVNVVVFAIAGLVSGLTAIWYGLQFTVEPFMGDRTVIYAFVVAFLAGTRTSPLRALAVGVGLGLIEQWSSLVLSVQWTQTAVFTVLVAYLIVLSGQGRWGSLLSAFRRPALRRAEA